MNKSVASIINHKQSWSSLESSTTWRRSRATVAWHEDAAVCSFSVRRKASTSQPHARNRFSLPAGLAMCPFFCSESGFHRCLRACLKASGFCLWDSNDVTLHIFLALPVKLGAFSSLLIFSSCLSTWSKSALTTCRSPAVARVQGRDCS